MCAGLCRLDRPQATVRAAFMQVAHTHEGEAPATYKLCSFCTTLDRGSAPPPVVDLGVPHQPTSIAPILPALPHVGGTSVRTPRQPRAPPPALQA
jgi:hypothetical protein